VMADGIPRLTIENESNMPNLNWKINNSSISKLYLYRSKNGQPFLKYKTIASTDRSFKDMNVIQDSTYSSALKARDKKGKETGFSNIVKWSSSD
jgi:hypothetical protein